MPGAQKLSGLKEKLLLAQLGVAEVPWVAQRAPTTPVPKNRGASDAAVSDVIAQSREGNANKRK